MAEQPAEIIRICWHGGASYSLDLGGLEVLVDPAFSRPGDYPPWFDDTCANPHAPLVADYLTSHNPGYVFLSHGHFDHFDLRTIERLAAVLDFRVVGSAEILKACRDILALASDRLRPCPVLGDGWLDLEPPDGRMSVRVAALPGPHWFTGPEGDAVAAKLAGRPARYGAMPCGGPMLGFLFEVGGLRLYASGDTEPAGLPGERRSGPLDAAVISCGGELINPTTRLREGPYLDEATLAQAVCLVVRPRVLVPVHYDHPVFQTVFDPSRLASELAGYPDPPRLVTPPYGEWVTLA